MLTLWLAARRVSPTRMPLAPLVAAVVEAAAMKKLHRLIELAAAIRDSHDCNDEDYPDGHEPHDGDIESCWRCFARWALGDVKER